MNKITAVKFHTVFIAALLLVPLATTLGAEVCNLRCEYLSAPLGIDVVKPRLSWVIESPLRGESQTAYRVLVASSPEDLKKDRGDVWDSGKVASDRSIQVEYSGKPLESRMRCYWKVRIWDKDGKASDWSRPASWTMGLLQPADWKGMWIGLDEPPREMPATTNKAMQAANEIASRRLPARWLRKELRVQMLKKS